MKRENFSPQGLVFLKMRGRGTAYYLKNGTEKKLSGWEGDAGEKKGAERYEEQEVNGKVIAVSTWSTA